MHMADQGQTKSWDTNHYILAALGGTLAATAVVIIISLVLSPAHVTFSVAHASRKNSSDGSAKLMVTVAANNPSRRCRAKYQSVFIDLNNSTSPAGKNSIHANVLNTTFQKEYLWGPSVMLINASALHVKEDIAKAIGFAKHLNSSGFTVVVRALVRFKVGVICTRLYEIKVFCPHVFFPDEGSNPTAQQDNIRCSG